MSKTVRFLLVGGFLGSGKTTTIARLARHYMQLGLQVGVVTNDQANDLVDTMSLQTQGFLVGEVSGACFCCRFNDLTDALAELGDGRAPDVIIAEPVGSCADLVATVIEPLRRMFADQYTVGPLAVLLKPEHGLRILRRDQSGGFSPQAAYIFLKQIEEADVVVINKSDKLTDAQREELIRLVNDQFPDKSVLAISAWQGDNFEQLIQALDGPPPTTTSVLQMDYDTYAEGEAELGWLNCQLLANRVDDTFSLDQLVLDIVTELGAGLADRQAEIAHIKVLGQDEGGVSLANQVGGGQPAELSRFSQRQVRQADLIVNARVATQPALLESTLRDSLQRLSQRTQIDLRVSQLSCFQPGRPEPTHRVSGD